MKQIRKENKKQKREIPPSLLLRPTGRGKKWLPSKRKRKIFEENLEKKKEEEDRFLRPA
jgi:hypothetical protein